MTLFDKIFNAFLLIVAFLLLRDSYLDFKKEKSKADVKPWNETLHDYITWFRRWLKAELMEKPKADVKPEDETTKGNPSKSESAGADGKKNETANE